MFHRRRLLSYRWLLIALVAALAVPATAEEGACYQTAVDEEGNPTGPMFCTQQVWFTDNGTKAGNLAATGMTDFPTWDTTEPTTSVTGGAGGGYFTNGVGRQMASDPESDAYLGATWEGAFTGNIDNMVVELFMFAPATAAADPPGAYIGSIELHVDGQQVMLPTQADLELEPGGDAVLTTSFAITDVHRAMETYGLETGDDVEHDVRFFFSAYGLASATAIVVYDTTEVPAGITFNVAELDPALPVFPAW